MGKRNALGKGLGRSFREAEGETSTLPRESFDQTDITGTGHRIVEISTSDIEPSPHQPRTEFDPKALDELARSIKEKGIIQPLTV